MAAIVESKVNQIRRQIMSDALPYYQAHPDEFCEDLCEIKLNLYQKLIMRAFFRYQYVVLVLCRGLGKSFLGALCLVIYTILYHHTKAGIIAPSFRQAKKVIEEKIIGEIMEWSPFIYNEIEDFKCNQQVAKVVFYNGSFIEAFPLGNDGAKIRGARLHVVMIDEAAYVPQYIIDTVVKPMMIVVRDYKVDAAERNDDTSQKNKLLIVSTAYYRFNHLYKIFTEYFKQMIKADNDKYFALSLPYTVGVSVGLFDGDFIEQQRLTMSDIEFEMEYNARFPKLVDGAWISYDDLEKCSNLGKMETEGVDNFDYIMTMDIARVEGKDNSIINVYKLHYCKTHIEGDLVYIRSMNGMPFEEQAQQVRELLKRYPNVIRIYMDTVGVGKGVTDELAKDYWDIDEQKWYPPLIDMNNKTDMANIERTHGIPLIYGVSATSEINHRMGMAIKVYTQKGWIHFYPESVEEDRDLTLEENKLIKETKATKMEILSIQAKPNGQFYKFYTTDDRKDRWSAVGLGTRGMEILQSEIQDDDDDNVCEIKVSARS